MAVCPMILRHVELHLGQIFFQFSAEGLLAICSHLTLIVLTLRTDSNKTLTPTGKNLS